MKSWTRMMPAYKTTDPLIAPNYFMIMAFYWGYLKLYHITEMSQTYHQESDVDRDPDLHQTYYPYRMLPFCIYLAWILTMFILLFTYNPNIILIQPPPSHSIPGAIKGLFEHPKAPPIEEQQILQHSYQSQLMREQSLINFSKFALYYELIGLCVICIGIWNDRYHLDGSYENLDSVSENVDDSGNVDDSLGNVEAHA